nr:hypothetical protein [Mycobacterium ulcerans]
MRSTLSSCAELLTCEATTWAALTSPVNPKYVCTSVANQSISSETTSSAMPVTARPGRNRSRRPRAAAPERSPECTFRRRPTTDDSNITTAATAMPASTICAKPNW